MNGSQNLTVSGGTGVNVPIGSIVLLTAQTGACSIGTGSVCNGLWVVNTSAWTRPVSLPHGYVVPASCTLSVVDQFSKSTYSLSDGSSALTVDASAESWTRTAGPAAGAVTVPMASNAVRSVPTQTNTSTSARSVNVLNAGTHADTDIAPAINAVLGTGFVDSSIFVDYDPPANIFQAVSDSIKSSAALDSVASGTAANHAPYGVINGSYCCSKGEGDDPIYYTSLYSTGTILSTPLAVQVGGALPAGTAPPTYSAAASSSNSSNGGTGWGIEFGLRASYLGLDTTEDSWVSAEVAGLLAALEFAHPTWTWFDVKAALRQTASNWSSGYSHGTFGYGYVNYSAASALSAASSLYLQPPGLNITNQQNQASVLVFPFRQTRRAFEAVYAIDASYTWPVKNEYTLTDIDASKATLIFTSSATDVVSTFTFTPAATGTARLLAFTGDSSGNYSRAEEFSVAALSLTEGTTCSN